MKFAVLGFGGRGSLYSGLFLENSGVELAAVCDIKQERLALAKKRFNLSDDRLYLSDKEFFSKGKLADICIVSTLDHQHHTHALMALAAGYNLLLEKPIANSEEDCTDIYTEAKRLGKKVFVCHVLRYAPFFATIKKEFDSGEYGRIATVNLTENVAYWHQAHSYVRGNWRNSNDSSPMIIAKCCHDLDILSWVIGEKCEYVSSFGDLSYFTRDNAPEGSADRCLNCKYNNSCVYSAEKFYIKERAEKGNLSWPCDILVSEPTVEKLYDALKNGQYGQCVYKCDNNVVDRQIVNMQFCRGITASLTMTAFSNDCYREIHVHGETGEIFGDMLNNKLTCNIYGKSTRTLDINIIGDTSYGHGGGDMLLVKDIINDFENKPSIGLTTIENSLESHHIGFAAERSRLQNGNVIKL